VRNAFIWTAPILGLIIGAGSFAAAQPCGGGYGMMGGMSGGMMGSMPRHHEAMMRGVPPPYSTARNPLSSTTHTLQRGAAVFAQNCAACHGATGQGNGQAGRSLSPRPANLAWLSRMPMMTRDSYLYWAIEEGGKPTGSAMPAFKGVLPEKDVWAVVTYIQHGFGRETTQHHCG
jgi:mono/diheme cytochrome c family protein